MSERKTGHVWKLVEHFMAEQRFAPTLRELAREMGVVPSTLGSWKYCTAMGKPEHLHALARVLDVSYSDVLAAAMMDAGYLQDYSSLVIEVKPEDIEIVSREGIDARRARKVSASAGSDGTGRR